MNTQKKAFELYPEQRELIQKLIAFQGDQTDAVFSASLEYSGSTWNKIKHSISPDKAGNYFADVQKPEKVFESLQQSLNLLERKRQRGERAHTESFFEFKPFMAAMKAIDDCLVKAKNGDPNRFIIFLAETGGGKSALCQQVEISGKFKGVTLEAREKWKENGTVSTRAIAEACGLQPSTWWPRTRIEDELIRFCNTRKVVLCIDEGEYFGPGTLNLFKLLLNQSNVVILVAAIPKSYERWTDSTKATWHEAKQLIRRTHAVIRGPVCNRGADAADGFISDSDAARFFTDLGLSPKELEGVSARAAAAANTFGNYDFLKRLAAEMRNRPNVNPAEVGKAIEVVHALMGVQATTKARS